LATAFTRCDDKGMQQEGFEMLRNMKRRFE